MPAIAKDEALIRFSADFRSRNQLFVESFRLAKFHNEQITNGVSMAAKLLNPGVPMSELNAGFAKQNLSQAEKDYYTMQANIEQDVRRQAQESHWDKIRFI